MPVAPYNPDWPKMFETEAARIQKALGTNCSAVHHVGSTSVPGLMAKPIIDIIAVIKDRDTVIGPLESLGYEYRGEFNIPMRLFFNLKEPIDVNLHVYEEGHPEIELNLVFRDYLRSHPAAKDAYAAVKSDLIRQPNAFQKINPPFTVYALGKHECIRNIQKQTGFNKIRFVRCAHHIEWDATKTFRQKYFFDKVPISDPYTWTFDHPDHVHFALYQGLDIIGYAHLQFWPENRAALRIIVIDETLQNKGYGGQFLNLLERWLKIQGYHSIHVESSPAALAFYRHHGYTDMPFHDPDGYESDPKDTAIGKIL